MILMRWPRCRVGSSAGNSGSFQRGSRDSLLWVSQFGKPVRVEFLEVTCDASEG